MSPIRPGAVLLACYFFIALVPRPAGAQVKHIGLTATDRFRFCAASVFGKLILTDLEYDDLLGSICHDGEAPETLEKNLLSKDISVLEGSQFVYLTFSHRTKPQEFSVSWLPMNGIVLPPGCKALTQAELNDIGRVVLRQARMPSFPLPYTRQNEQIEAKLFLVLNECELKVGVESVVGVLGGSRLIYGEMRDGTFKFLWDSPEFCLPGEAYQAIDLRDMNASGVRDILIEYQVPGGSASYDGLAIFDIDGNELNPFDDSFTGESFRYETREDGKVDVLVVNNEGTDRYSLADGRYTVKLAANSRKAKEINEAVVLNEEGVRLMNEGRYQEAASRFQSACFDDDLPLYSNNLGFALYKSGQYESSVWWFQKALRLDPKRSVAYLNLGDAYVKLNRTAEARQAYTKYLELAPNSKSAPDVKKKLAALPPTS